MSNSLNDVEKGKVEASLPTQVYQSRPSRIANPGSLGLLSFASTTFMLSMYNTQVRHITTPNVVVGMAVACGGLAQFMAGMWEFPRGNTFGATAFTTYGAFWISYALILIPGSGIVTAFGGPTKEFENAVGIYLITWVLVTAFLGIAVLRKHVAFILLFVFLDLTFILLAAGAFNINVNCNKAGGVLGVITAFIAYYIAVGDLLAAETHPVFTLPMGVIKND